MADTTYDTSRIHEGEDWRAVSWSAILFGSLVGLSVAAMLHVLGLAVTASSVPDQAGPTDALMTIGGVAGIWYIASTAVSLFVGGFVASTLAWTFTGKRAAIYALGVWAVTTLVVALAFVPPIIRAGTGAVSAVGNVADRAIATAAGAGEAVGSAAANVPSGLVDDVRQRLGIPSGTQVDQGAIRDITRLVGQRLTGNEWTPQQRDQVIAALGRAANVPPEEARRRLGEAESALNTAIQEARDTVPKAVEATRQAIAGVAYWTFAAILAGLVAAYFGARFGEREESELPTFARIRTHRTSN